MRGDIDVRKPPHPAPSPPKRGRGKYNMVLFSPGGRGDRLPYFCAHVLRLAFFFRQFKDPGRFWTGCRTGSDLRGIKGRGISILF